VDPFHYGDAMDIDERLQTYAEKVSSPHDPLLAELSEETHRSLGSGQMLTGPVAGRLLELLVWAQQPRRVLEIGTFSGHATLSMAAALPRDGHIDTCELEPESARVAQAHFDRSPWAGQITIHVGPASETIGRLVGTFDLVFMDADKTGYVGYYEATLPRLSEHGLIVADNTLHGGRVLDPGDPIAAFNDHVAADERSSQVLLTVRDGMTLIRRA
jgi:caffeoyl-CoA O-methyltransferase